MSDLSKEVKRKILYISLYTEIGGGEVGLFHLLKNLDKSRFQPVVLFNKGGPFVDKLEEIGIQTLIIPFVVAMLQHCIKPRIFWSNFKAAWEIKSYIKQQQIDIVQCGDVLSLLLLIPAMLLNRVPIVFNVIFFYERSRAFLLSFLSLFGVKRVAGLSSMVMADLQRKTFGLEKKLKLIYWGVDTSQFYRRTNEEKILQREKLGLPLDKKIIGFIGRYEVWKGHETFLNAASKLLQTRNDLFFLMVGGAMTEDIIPGVARYRLKIIDRIRNLKFHDRLMVWGHRDDIPDVMASLDVFVCPSDHEPFGLVVLEAVACGLPVVVSRTVGAVEVLEGVDSLFLAEPKNPDSFAMMIDEALIKSNTVIPLKELKLPTWEAFSRRYMEIYEKLPK